MVFSESFYGYSTALMPNGRELARYLSLILTSEIAVWIALVTSGKFGVEREVIEKSALDRVVLDPAADRRAVRSRCGPRTGAWEAVVEWACRAYCPDDRDRTVIKDTLRYCSPYAQSRQLAQSVVTPDLSEMFRTELEKELSPVLGALGSDVAVGVLPGFEKSPWRVVRVSGGRCPSNLGPAHLMVLLQAADRLAVTEATLQDGERSLCVARLHQARSWTSTQARLCA